MKPIKQLIIFTILTIIISACSPSSTTNYEALHKQQNEAIAIVQKSLVAFPADSLLFQNEFQRVVNSYQNISDSLKMHSDSATYAHFAAQMLINLSYSSPNINKLQAYNKLLFELSANYPKQIENDSLQAEKIAKCVVNSLEGSGVPTEVSLMQLIKQTIRQHYQMVKVVELPIDRQKSFVNRYAAQYYRRGIISIAEPVFREFEDIYKEKVIDSAQVYMPFDAQLFNADLINTNTNISSLDPLKIVITPKHESPFHLIYLISQLRAANRFNPYLPIVILRNTKTISIAYLKGLRNNLAVANYYLVNVRQNDLEHIATNPTFVVVNTDGSIAFATNNDIDFLKWLEAPFAEQDAKNEQLRLAKYREHMAKKNNTVEPTPIYNIQQKISLSNAKITFSGLWPKEVEIKTKYYYLTQSNYTANQKYPQIVTLEVFSQQNQLYALDYVQTNKPIKLTLTYDVFGKIRAHFNDDLNQQLYTKTHIVDSLTSICDAYKQIITEYPYKHTEFVASLKKLQSNTQASVQQHIASKNNIVASVLQFKNKLQQLQHAQPPDSISYSNFANYFPVATFDTIIWRSPYYKLWVDSWLMYGSNDTKTAIDLLLASTSILPNHTQKETINYLWKKMNAQGRSNMMIHIDTMYMVGCMGDNIDVQKRIAGYKRMAIGNKAPNIQWDENGESMRLYELVADTIIVVFWADWCEHCKKELPIMHKRLSTHKNIEVLAIALDDDESSIENAKRLLPDWHHMRAKEIWDDKNVKLYNVLGTPTQYILNNDCRILDVSM